MLGDRARHVHLIRHRESVFDRNRHQPGRSGGQKRHDIVEVRLRVSGHSNKRRFERGARAVTLVVGLARIDANGALGLQIMPAHPAREGRQVVGVECCNRAGGIFARLAKRAVPIALEHHDEIGPHTPGREGGAEIFRNRAEVLADHDTVPASALFGDHRQHVGER